MAFKVYLMGLRDDVGKMLKDMNVCWGYVGADGKPGYTYEWSASHPLIKILEVGRKYGINIEIGFVIGRRGHTWEEIDMWKRFRDRLIKEYEDVITYLRAAATIVFPDSPDWYLLCSKFPEFGKTSSPDLLDARIKFYENFTSLGSNGSEVLRKLYSTCEEFKFVSEQSFWGGYV
jgi:hypothetical protein